MRYYRTDGNSASYNDAVIPSGAINGVEPGVHACHRHQARQLFLVLYLNGEELIAGVDYTLSGSNITMTVAPQAASGGTAADWLVAWSRIDGVSSDSSSAEVPSGAINGSNTAFTLGNTPSPLFSLMLFQNHALLLPGTNYTIVGANITHRGRAADWRLTCCVLS
jgi:hypothetical protein